MIIFILIANISFFIKPFYRAYYNLLNIYPVLLPTYDKYIKADILTINIKRLNYYTK